jgi:pimeloyl-ACP methyl ester carboxylesterase
MNRHLSSKVQIGKSFKTILPAAAILIVGILGLLGFLVYRITNPGAVPEHVNPSHFLLPSLEVSIPSGDGAEIQGWWIPGLKGAPGIVLAPGYGMSRSDALSLAAVLHESGFNLLIFDQRGSGAAPRGSSTFGIYETEDMLHVLNYVQSRPESNRERLGIWGVDVGAFTALKAAASVPEVRAIAADGAFESPADFLNYRLDEDFGLDNLLIQFGCRQIFRLVHVKGGLLLDEKIPVQPLSDRTILFIKGENRRGLGRLTSALYDGMQPQREMISFKNSRIHLMSGEDLKSYDRQVANFFHLNLQ